GRGQPVNHFQRRKGQLCCEEVPLSELAEEVGTPAYVYSTATLLRHARVFRAALRGLDVLACFAVKSAPNLALLVLLARDGFGFAPRDPRRRRRLPHRLADRLGEAVLRSRGKDAGPGPRASLRRPRHPPARHGRRSRGSLWRWSEAALAEGVRRGARARAAGRRRQGAGRARAGPGGERRRPPDTRAPAQ